MMRDSFIFYDSFYAAICELPDDIQLQVYTAVMRFALKGEEPDLTGVAKAVFLLIKPQIAANNRRFENGCKGGAPKGNQNARKQPKTTEAQPNSNQAGTKTQPNVNVNVNDINKKEIKNKEKRKNNQVVDNSDHQALSTEDFLANCERLKRLTSQAFCHSDQLFIDENFYIPFNDPLFQPYVLMPERTKRALQVWLKKKFNGKAVDKKWIAEKLVKFGTENGDFAKMMELAENEEGGV